MYICAHIHIHINPPPPPLGPHRVCKACHRAAPWTPPWTLFPNLSLSDLSLSLAGQTFEELSPGQFFPPTGKAEGPETTRITCTVSMGTRNYVFRTSFRTNFTWRIAAGQVGHSAERDPFQSFRTMYFIFPHSSDVFGGGGGNITPQV